MNIETLLNEEIEDQLDEISKLDLGSESYKVAVDGVVKLIDRKIEMDKIEIEKTDKIENRKIDDDWKRKQMKDEKLDRWIKNGVAIAGIIIPSAITIWGTVKSFEFEKEGTITTIMGRGFINKLIPRK